MEHCPCFITSLAVFNPELMTCRPVEVAPRPYHSLSYRLSGEVTVETGGERRLSRIGSLTFVPAGCAYTTEVLSESSMIVAHFMTSADYISEPMVYPAAYPMVFRNLFSELLSRYKVGGETDYGCFSVFYEILSEWEHEREQQKGQHTAVPKRCLDAKNTIDAHFDDLTLSISRLAAEAGISETYFRREFASCFGMSPHRYITKVRMDNAKALLAAGYYSVTEVALHCGYPSISHFSGEFRRHVGVSPREYPLRHTSY